MSRIDNLRLRVSDWVGGSPRQREFEELIRIAGEARRGSYIITSSNLEQRLREIDSQTISTLLNLSGFELIGGTFDLEYSEQDRLRAVRESRFMYHSSVLSKRAVRMMTDFGFGRQISIKLNDEIADEDFQEFWSARRNAPILSNRKIHKLSDDLLVDGEYFFIFFVSEATGETTLRRIKTDEIESIIRDPDDKSVTIFYKRKFKSSYLYYRDYNADDDIVNQTWEQIQKADRTAKRADLEKEGTFVFMIQVERNEYNGRGWPEFIGSGEWDRTYTHFIGSVAARAEAVAAFVDEIIHKGGSRVQDRIERKFNSLTPTLGYEGNPMPPAGSPMVHSDDITVNRRPFATGAADTQKDKFAILSLFSAGTGIPPHWLGNPDAMQNKAVADSTELPFHQQAQRYQIFWTDVFVDIVHIVLDMLEKYGNRKYQDKSATVNLEIPIDISSTDIKNLSTVVSDFFDKGILTDAKQIEFLSNQIMSVVLSELGSKFVEPTNETVEEKDIDDINFSFVIAAEKLRNGEISLVEFLSVVTDLERYLLDE